MKLGLQSTACLLIGLGFHVSTILTFPTESHLTKPETLISMGGPLIPNIGLPPVAKLSSIHDVINGRSLNTRDQHLLEFNQNKGSTENIDVGTELPVFYEVVTEEISITEREEMNSTPEETTTLWSATDSPEAEESTQTQFPQAQFTHPDQQEIMNELHNIWYYSEGLNEEQNDLKSSLSSLVHMTYARVYDQENETLGRLKHLLRKLRTKLLNEETFNDETTTTEMSVTSESANNDTELTESYIMRKKRSSDKRDYLEDTIFANADPNDNFLFPHKNEIFDKPQKSNVNPVLTNNSDATLIQKLFKVNEHLPFVPIKDIDLGITQIPILTSQNPDETGTAETTFEPINGFKDKIGNEDISGDENNQSKNPATVEEIINKIIAVLHSPSPLIMKYSTSKPLIKDVHNQTPIVIKLKPLTSGFSINDNEEFHNLPSYLNKFLGMTPSPEFNYLKPPVQASLNLTDYLSFQSDNVELSEEGNLLNSSAKPNASAVGEVTSTELSPTVQTSSPTKFLNDTMLSMLTFLNVLTALSNTARMILLFSLTALILSIVLGFNSSLGLPIAVLGGLAFIIPIFLLLLFQTNRGKFKSVKDHVWNNVNVEDVNKVLELLADAIDKYQ